MLDFTHRYWLEDTFAQLQAPELLQHLRRQMRLRELEWQGELADSTQLLNVIAAVGIAVKAIVGFFCMNFFKATEGVCVAARDLFCAVVTVMAGLAITCRGSRWTAGKLVATRPQFSTGRSEPASSPTLQ